MRSFIYSFILFFSFLYYVMLYRFILGSSGFVLGYPVWGRALYMVDMEYYPKLFVLKFFSGKYREKEKKVRKIQNRDGK